MATKYTEIFRLASLMLNEEMNFNFCTLYDGYTIRLLNECNEEIIDCIQHKYSYGAHQNQLECWSFEDGDVIGYLTAEEVLEEFKWWLKWDKSKRN